LQLYGNQQQILVGCFPKYGINGPSIQLFIYAKNVLQINQSILLTFFLFQDGLVL
jgi:hypothetical protein